MLIFRTLKRLKSIIYVSVVHHFMNDNGWTLRVDSSAIGDMLYRLYYLHQI